MTEKLDPEKIKFNKMICDLYRSELGTLTARSISRAPTVKMLEKNGIKSDANEKNELAAKAAYEKAAGLSWDADKYFFDKNYDKLIKKYNNDKSRMIVIKFMQEIEPDKVLNGLKKLRGMLENLGEDIYTKIREIEGLYR